MNVILTRLSAAIMPTVVLMILLLAVRRKTDAYTYFVDGAKEGVETVFKILPALVGLLAAIGMFRASGALELLLKLVSPVTSFLKIPSEVAPLIFLKPVSGSGSIAIVTELIHQHGPDSMIGRIVSVMMGSTETTFYTLAVYFGAVGIRNTRHTLQSALIADAVGMILSVYVCQMFFRMM